MTSSQPHQATFSSLPSYVHVSPLLTCLPHTGGLSLLTCHTQEACPSSPACHTQEACPSSPAKMSIVCAEVVHSYTHSLSWGWCITMIMTLCVVCESKIYMAATHMTKVTVKATIVCYTTHSLSHITLSFQNTHLLSQNNTSNSPRPYPKTATCTLSQHT